MVSVMNNQLLELKEPLEDDEQMQVVQFLELNHLKFTAVPNSTYTTSWKQKNHNTAMGLRAGFPDLIILIPPNVSLDGLGHFLPLEMKRRKTFKVSEDQKSWISALNGLGIKEIDSVIAHGADEAIEYIASFLKHPIAVGN